MSKKSRVITTKQAEMYAEKMISEFDWWQKEINSHILKNRELIEKYCAVKFYSHFYDDCIGGVQRYKIIHHSGDYDYSGELKEDGIIDTYSDPLWMVLEHEYNGQWKPTYQSRYGRYWKDFTDDYEEYYRDITACLVHKMLFENADKISNDNLEPDDINKIYYLIIDDLLFETYWDFVTIASGPWSEKELAIPFGDFLKLGKDSMTFIYNFCKENNFDEFFCNYYKRENANK